MQDEVSDDKPFDMTLRLWSDSVPLDLIASQTGLKAGRLHRKGEQTQVRGRVIEGIVDRHFASIARARGEEEEVANWIKSTLDSIESHHDLVQHLTAGNIEGLLWIARLRGGDGSSMPPIDPALVDLASGKGLRIFLENYTDFDREGVPKREWLPA